ncbi:MAG: PAS domain S-box protein [Candidatus Riflebacteria bacterium]|nr:PAS domain S-box protein [Candidatus Riflebacteria bacterium]
MAADPLPSILSSPRPRTMSEWRARCEALEAELAALRDHAAPAAIAARPLPEPPPGARPADGDPSGGSTSQAEEAACWQAWFDQTPEAVAVWSAGSHVRVNRPYLHLFGFDDCPEQLPGTVLDLIEPAGQQPVGTFLAAHAQGRHRVTAIETRGLRRHGGSFDLGIRLVGVHWPGAPQAVATLTDLTPRRQAQEALRAAEDKARELVDSMMDGYLRCDLEGRLVDFNPAFRAMLGYPVDRLYAMTLQDLTPARWHPVEEAIVRNQVLVRGYSDVYEKELRCLDGAVIPVEVRTLVVRDSSGAPSATWAIVRDVRERRHAEEERQRLERQMQHAQKLESLGVLAGGIAHDFNNLLMVTFGHLDLLRRQLDPASQAHWNLQEIEKASRRAADLCQQMLAYSGKGRFEVKAVDLAEVIRDLVIMLEVSVSRKALLQFDLAPALPPVAADVTQIRQVVMNLVINASEAMAGRNGVIRIATGVTDCDQEFLASTWLDEHLPAGPYLWLEVADNGSGMDPLTRSRIFDPFFTTKFAGRGLGLAAVLGIVRGHRGAIQVESEPGHGTTFRIFLPTLRQATQQASPLGPAPDWRGSGIILLVDDQETIRSVGTALLQGLGFSVVTAADGVEALEILAAAPDRFVLVLLDLTMPRLDGVETFQAMVQRGLRVPVVMVSGYTEQEVSGRLGAVRPAGFLQKPFQQAGLTAVLSRLLPAAPAA